MGSDEKPVDTEEHGAASGEPTHDAMRFGEIATALGFLSAADVVSALGRQEAAADASPGSRRIGDILVEQGKLTSENVTNILAEQEQLERANPGSLDDIARFLSERRALAGVAGPSSLEELARRLDDLERKAVGKERVEQIAASAALDVLKLYERDLREAIEGVRGLQRAFEKREFARKVADCLSTSICRKGLEEPVGDIVHFEFEKAVEARAQQVFDAELQTPKVAKRVREIAGASKEIESASRRLARRLDQIEQEAMPKRLEKLFTDKLEQKLGDVSAEAIAAKIERKVIQRQLKEVAHDVIAELLLKGELRAMLNDSLLDVAMRGLVNSQEFKQVLDLKFKTMTTYIAEEVIPKHLGRGGSS
jgi:hypothetical protein